MSNTLARAVRLLAATLVAGFSPACQGEIIASPGGDVVAGPPGAPGTGVDPTLGGSAPGAAPGSSPSAADAQMRANDPELFELASRYFPGDAAAPSDKRLSRLTRMQLDRTARALLPAHHSGAASAIMPADPLQTNYEYAENLGFNAANFTPYTAWVDALAASVQLDPGSVIGCSQSDATCLERSAREFVTRAFRGVVSAPQLDRYATFYASSVAEVGLAQATADLVSLSLTAPAFVFRDEVLTGADGALLPAQALQNVAYTLADAPPEALGLSLPSDGALDAAALTQAVERALATPEAREKLLRFFVAFLEVREPDDFAIDREAFPEFTPEVAAGVVEETHAFLRHQLAGAAPSLKSITQSTESFVSEAIAFLYDAVPAAEGELAALDPRERLGIFTQPAVIASHSGPTTTRLVKRGVFFTRKVMCLPLGAPPEDVDTSVPELPDATERQRIESGTAAARCQGCHAFINPFGFMQESFDPIGRFRTLDEGQPVDPSIAIDFLDEGPLQTTTSVEALRGLTHSARFKQCFARQLFRFYMGRDERAGDNPLLRQMFFGFASEDTQDIVGLLRALASSAAFSQRGESP